MPATRQAAWRIYQGSQRRQRCNLPGHFLDHFGGDCDLHYISHAADGNLGSLAWRSDGGRGCGTARNTVFAMSGDEVPPAFWHLADLGVLANVRLAQVIRDRTAMSALRPLFP